MQPTKLLKEECLRLIEDLRCKINISDEKINFLNLIDQAESEGSFNREEYIYTEDEETLYDLLTYSLGLSALWREYKKEKPNAPMIEVNRAILQYMLNMWGLEKVQPPIQKGIEYVQ